MIPKVARDAAPYERRFIAFPTARAAFRAFLEAVGAERSGGVLLPAYIGWSPREGSGVFDPVRESGTPYAFYRMTPRLEIDVAHLREQLEHVRPRVLLLIHFFGYVDPAYDEVVRCAEERGVLVLEDEAHALLTDFIGGTTGRLGVACLASLHKLLPVETGGGLIVNPMGRAACAPIREGADAVNPWDFDLAQLARRRRHNAASIEGALGEFRGRVEPLWPLTAHVVPQTYPVLVHGVSRDRLYEQMNAAGFGVVSLYHTLVDAIPPAEFPASHELARTIMNLPVHQEATEAQLVDMLDALDRLTRSPG
jgi:dTDP-4-amino-4,6-dideoxygalactose transaminase